MIIARTDPQRAAEQHLSQMGGVNAAQARKGGGACRLTAIHRARCRKCALFGVASGATCRAWRSRRRFCTRENNLDNRGGTMAYV